MLISLPRYLTVDANGAPRRNAKLYVYDAGTTAPRNTYTTAALDVPHTNPVRSGTDGLFPAIYITGAADYKFVLETSTDVPVWTEDNLSVVGFDRDDLGRILDPQTNEESAANLPVVQYVYDPLDLWRYLTLAQVTDATTGTASIDVSTHIQAAIDYASAMYRSMGNTYNPMVSTLQIPRGKYGVGSTLTMDDNLEFCNIDGNGATFVSTAAGACLHIGNSTSFGILPARIRRLNFQKANNSAGSIALKIEHAANSAYEECGVTGFETGILLKGSINVLLDGKRRAIASSTTGIRVESSPNGGGLRFSNNILTIRGYIIHADIVNGIVCDTGSGVTPIGVGGTVKIVENTFELLNASGRALYFNNMGEIPLYDDVEVYGNHFEGYGATLMSIANSRVYFGHNFIANASTKIFELLDNNSYLEIDRCRGYFTDALPGSGCLVSLGGTATSEGTFHRIRYRNSSFPPLKKLHALYPTVLNELDIRDDKFTLNYGFTASLTVFDEVSKLVGDTWRAAMIVFVGGDGIAIGRARLQLYKFAGVYTVKDLDGNVSDYTLTNENASNATMTFSNTNGRWTGMVAIYTVDIG